MPEQDGLVLGEIEIAPSPPQQPNTLQMTLNACLDENGDPRVVQLGPKLRLVSRVPSNPGPEV